MYILNSKGTRTDPWGMPFCSCRRQLHCPSLACPELADALS